MMAEQKFSELQKLIEVQLTFEKESRYELLSLYVDAIKAQEKIVPPEIILELAEHYSETHEHSLSHELLSNLPLKIRETFFIRLAKIEMKAAVDKGQMGELYTLIANFYLRQFEKQMPFVPSWIRGLSAKYFSGDFNLHLKDLALALLTNDVDRAIELTKVLLVGCVEKSSPKGTQQKLNLLSEVLRSGGHKGHLEIYQSYCLLAARESLDKTDYKKIVEMIIGFDDFKFQVMVLNLLHQHNLIEEAQSYSEVLKGHENYDYVYFDKFFPRLKSYFYKFNRPTEEEKKPVPSPDLDLEHPLTLGALGDVVPPESSDDLDTYYLNFLKYQNFSADQLCDLAVSFLQSEMPKVALRASELVILNAHDDQTFLKGSYLKLTALLQLLDYRAALDTCLEALSKARSEDDVLSFLYAQAEIYMRVQQKTEAKQILKQILSIDAKYRSAKERLEKL